MGDSQKVKVIDHSFDICNNCILSVVEVVISHFKLDFTFSRMLLSLRRLQPSTMCISVTDVPCFRIDSISEHCSP